jgi:hypothetical protein
MIISVARKPALIRFGVFWRQQEKGKDMDLAA